MKVYLKTVGCRVNQIETQSLMEKLISFGCVKEDDFAAADVVIINSCSVTAKSDRDVFKFIKKSQKINPGVEIIVTGCGATLYPSKIFDLSPNIRIVPNKDKQDIPFFLTGKKSKKDFFSVKKFYGHTRAFIKIQDGCNLKCSYCIVSKARPALESKPLKAVLSEVSNLVKSGYREIVLCGIRLGAYLCPAERANLSGLVKRIFEIEGDFRIRFSSIEAHEITNELLDELEKGGEKFCSYFHIPLQSGSDKVLKEMRRICDSGAYKRKILEIRKKFPKAGIFTDIMVGYPTESDADFNQSLEFIKKNSFSGLHVFSYSPRPGAESFNIAPLNPLVVKNRSVAMRELDAEMRLKFSNSLIGSVQRAIVLKNNDGNSVCLSSNFQNIHVKGKHEIGSFINVHIIGAESGLCGGVISHSPIKGMRR